MFTGLLYATRAMITIKVKQGTHANREKNILLCNDCILNYKKLNTIECL